MKLAVGTHGEAHPSSLVRYRCVGSAGRGALVDPASELLPFETTRYMDDT